MSTEDILKGGQPIKIEEISGPGTKPHDILEFEALLRCQDAQLFGACGFEKIGKVVLTRAHSRLDIMGGIADYCGANVLESTLEPSAIVGCQTRKDRELRALSLGPESDSWLGLGISIDDFYLHGRLKSYSQIQELFARNPKTDWAAHVLGGFYAVLSERKISHLPHGATIALKSSIPACAGIASSAAIEISALMAINNLYKLGLTSKEIARIGQIVENRVVGVPCGPIDHIVAADGKPGEILSILCQPDRILGTVVLPPNTRLIGIDSKVKRASNAVYIDARTSTLMGLTILKKELNLKELRTNYLCNLSIEDFRQRCRRFLPTVMAGEQFIKRYGKLVDAPTEITPKKHYHIRSRVEHPIYEHARVRQFIRCIENAKNDKNNTKNYLTRAGQLMYASHWSYRYRVGLGSAQVEQIVNSVRTLGTDGGFYGARMSSRGEGGTVSVLCHGDISSALIQTLAAYKLTWGFEADIFNTTAPAAYESKHSVLRLLQA